jgi:hypothetical protein
MQLWQLILIFLATGCVHAVELPDESKMAPLVAALSDPQSEVRAAAAAKLKLIAAENQKVVAQAESYWREKIAAVKPGMKKEDVEVMLPPFAAQPDKLIGGSGSSHTETYRLDYHWMVTIAYLNKGEVMDYPLTLTRTEMSTGVAPPKDFTGVWTGWFVNGEKSYEIGYRSGSYDGAFISYHDNGRKCYVQHYTAGKIDGRDEGWHANGQKAYVGEYKVEKRAGSWTWWYADGNKQSERTYQDGVIDGVDRYWYENGQLRSEVNYRNGTKHGTEAAWDENGKLHYKREYENGEMK